MQKTPWLPSDMRVSLWIKPDDSYFWKKCDDNNYGKVITVEAVVGYHCDHV